MNKIIDIYLKGVIYILIRYIFRKKYLKANCRFIEANFKCYTVDGIGRHLFKYGIHELQNSLYLKENLSLCENEIALDIGSNLGWYSVLISRIASPKSIIHSFEADVANFELLQHNLVSNNCLNVKPHNVAISDSAGKTEFYKYPLKNAGRHSLIPQEGFEKISVNTTTLDKLLIDADKSKVKFIKIDIEGYEYFAFRGAEEILSHNPLIMMEFSPNLYQEKFSVEKLINLLVGHSYRPFLLRDGKLVEISFNDLRVTKEQVDVFLKQ